MRGASRQHALQQRLGEAMARLTASESETMSLASKKEAKATKQLQASEKAAVKAMALLDKKEEEVQQSAATARHRRLRGVHRFVHTRWARQTEWHCLRR
jgi:hypothetical protein